MELNAILIGLCDLFFFVLINIAPFETFRPYNIHAELPLMIVIDYEHSIELIKYLAEMSNDINATNDEGKTALMIATENNKANIVQILKTAGATE